MRVLKWIGISFGVLIGLAIAGAVGLWIWKPWVPPIELADPAPNGRRIVETGVFANYFPASGQGPHAGVVLLGGSEGGLSRGARHQAIELQKAGFAVLHVAYFRAPGMPKNLELVPLETFDRAIDWLGRQTDVDKSRIAIVGTSKGAEAALLVATRRHELRAVAAGVPSSVAWAGVNWDRGGGSVLSSWSLAGKPISALPYAAFDWRVGVLALYKNSLRDVAKHPDAIIAIERSQAPVMLVCGEADGLWPSCEMAQQVEARARSHAGPNVAVYAYVGAGHMAFGPPVPRNNPNYQYLAMMGGTAEGNAAARADSWPKLLKFLRTNLAAPAGVPQ